MIVSLGQLADLVWGPAHRADGAGICCSNGPRPGDGHREDCLFDALAQLEHEDWFRAKHLQGWQYGEIKNDDAKTNPLMVDWSRLTMEERKPTHQTVTDLFDGLCVLGYSPWYRVSRRGRADSAKQLERAAKVPGSSGSQTGQAGDWLVSVGGSERIVAASEFGSLYDPQTLERIGTLLARPAVAGEVVESLESPQTAGVGDWLVIGNAGERWPVPDVEFRKNYRINAYEEPSK